MRTHKLDMAAAVRRVPLEKPPTVADEAKVKRQKAIEIQRIGGNIKRARNEAR